MNIVVVGHYREDYSLGYYLDWRDAFLSLRPKHEVRIINTWHPFERPRPIMDVLPLAWSFDERPIADVYAGWTPCDLLVSDSGWTVIRIHLLLLSGKLRQSARNNDAKTRQTVLRGSAFNGSSPLGAVRASPCAMM